MSAQVKNVVSFEVVIEPFEGTNDKKLELTHISGTVKVDGKVVCTPEEILVTNGRGSLAQMLGTFNRVMMSDVSLRGRLE